jgi:hypothetical protein
VGIDIRSTGGQVVYPGSIYLGCDKAHKCGAGKGERCRFAGNRYEWIVPPGEVSIAPVPDWLLKVLSPSPVSAREDRHATPPVTSAEGQVKEPVAFKSKTKSDILPPTAEAVEGAVNLLSSGRANGYDTWLHVIWCLKKLSGQNIDLARRFSMKSSKFNEADFLSKWNEGRGEGGEAWGMGSLRKWVQEDTSPGIYSEFIRKYGKSGSNVSALDIDFDKADRGLANLYLKHYELCMKIIRGNGSSGYLWSDVETLGAVRVHSTEAFAGSRTLKSARGSNCWFSGHGHC